MSALHAVSPFIGAVALEAVRWFELREKLELGRYQKLLRSKSYWMATVAMAVVGGFITLIWFGDKLDPKELLVTGAAFPTLFRNLVGVATSKSKTTLGDADTNPVKDYFGA